MYSTCLFCSAALGTNESVEHFPVGRRLAFDSSNGRLWVVCVACGRWNLTPLEERWDAIDECEGLFRGTYVRVSTPNVGLARVTSGLELVRIGAPLRPEFAAWRYGRHFATRRRRSVAIAGAGVAAGAIGAVLVGPALLPALKLGAISIVAIPGLTSIMGVFPVVGTLAARDYIQHDRVVARFAYRRRMLTVRAKHLGDVELEAGRDARDVTVAIPHDDGWVEYRDTSAIHATSVLLAGANRFGAPSDSVQHAVRAIEDHGDAAGYLGAAAIRNAWRGRRVTSVLNAYRCLGALHLSPIETLALEMALHEETERRAMEGELAALESAWRDAEQIAKICDEEL